MNERIRELIAEADRKCSETRGIYDEILAELIVKECCDVVDYDNARAITNHFGNKEEPPVEKSRDLMKGVWKV